MSDAFSNIFGVGRGNGLVMPQWPKSVGLASHFQGLVTLLTGDLVTGKTALLVYLSAVLHAYDPLYYRSEQNDDVQKRYQRQLHQLGLPAKNLNIKEITFWDKNAMSNLYEVCRENSVVVIDDFMAPAPFTSRYNIIELLEIAQDTRTMLLLSMPVLTPIDGRPVIRMRHSMVYNLTRTVHNEQGVDVKVQSKDESFEFVVRHDGAAYITIIMNE
jgi:hypothetical protein